MVHGPVHRLRPLSSLLCSMTRTGLSSSLIGPSRSVSFCLSVSLVHDLRPL